MKRPGSLDVMTLLDGSPYPSRFIETGEAIRKVTMPILWVIPLSGIPTAQNPQTRLLEVET
jgi:hypothetical protein